jgi:sugar/nucleoside kinase (ribokinase family)
MRDKPFDVVALGSCYIDTNCEDYPFKDTGIPIETELVGGHYETSLGGSAVNFCSLLQTLGLNTTFLGMAGTDQNGDLLGSLLEQHGIQSALIRQQDILTNISFNMTNAEGKHIMLIAGTASAALTPESVVPKLEEIVPDAKMLYLGGYFKLKSLIPAFAQIADYAKQYETTLVVDHGRIPEGTSQETFDELRELVLKADYYFPSRKEFCELWNVGTIEDGLRLLSGQAPNVVAVVKDGENGAFYFAYGVIKHVEAVKVKVRNVTGAGDSFNAGVIAAITEGVALNDAVAYGCRVAATKITGEVVPPL